MSKAPNEKELLEQYLKDLHLPTFRSSFEELARQAQQESHSYERYLLELAQRETQERQSKRIERLLRYSQLPQDKSWPALDLKRFPPKVLQQARLLLEGSFVDRPENVLVFGSVGSGKTHLLAGVAQELVRAGRKVLFTTCSLLVQELLIAKRDLKLSRVLKRLAGYAVLVIDDLGYVQQSREELEVLFTLLAERYERGSVMLTSNLPFSQWEKIFKDAMTTAAAIDRLVHHSVIIELNLPSYRAEQAKKAKGGRVTEEEGAKPCDTLMGPSAVPRVSRWGRAPLRSPSLRSGSLRSARPQRLRAGSVRGNCRRTADREF
jgi:DNA replication protein DnaC